RALSCFCRYPEMCDYSPKQDEAIQSVKESGNHLPGKSKGPILRVPVVGGGGGRA
ncbi:hypothetical protein FQN60_000081, partial [Etheostoma spectabile]